MQLPPNIPRTARSSSSSSLHHLPIATKAHSRRPSRIPPSALVQTSPSPPGPLSISRLVAAVDALLPGSRRRKARRRFDRGVIQALIALFLALFLALFFLLRRALGHTASRITPDGPVLAEGQPQLVRTWRRGSVRLSIVAACNARTSFLRRALPMWISLLGPRDEIVLLDWGTDEDAFPIRNLIADHRQISVLTVNSPGPWALTHAYNLAFSVARGAWLLKLDCDTHLTNNFLQSHPLTSGLWYTFFREDAVDDNQRHLHGVFLAEAEAVRQVYGYDERIATYGFEADDLYARLEARFGKPAHFVSTTLSHASHSDQLRGLNQRLVMGPALEPHINRLALTLLPAWADVAHFQQSAFRLQILSRDARFVSAHVIHLTSPALHQLPPAKRAAVLKDATNNLLHDGYFFPWVVLDEINRSRPELARSLAAHPRRRNSPGALIFAEVGGSVPERLLGVASAIALALAHDAPLFLAWSAGARDDPTPRISDFFDVENSGVVQSIGRRAGARIYQVGRWRCRSVVAVCARSDSAFKHMAEFRTRGHADDSVAAKQVIEVLRGKAGGEMRNVLLRLEGAFPGQTTAERARALASLTLARPVARFIAGVGDVESKVGLYVGGVKERGADAMMRRLKAFKGDDAQYFITGRDRLVVEQVRRMLIAEQQSEEEAFGATKEIRDMTREVGELYALASCKDVVNEGRPPEAVVELVSMLQRKVGAG